MAAQTHLEAHSFSAALGVSCELKEKNTTNYAAVSLRKCWLLVFKGKDTN